MSQRMLACIGVTTFQGVFNPNVSLTMYPIRILLFLLISCGLLHKTVAQSTPPLERVVSVDFTNERIDNALKIISNKGQFSFAYNAALINPNSTLSLRTTNSVRALLNQIFRGTITYKSRGNHIILQKAEPPAEAPKSFILDGYITDRQNRAAGQSGQYLRKNHARVHRFEPVRLLPHQTID